MDHFKEAERLVEKSKNSDTSSAEHDDAERQTWAAQAQVHATLALAEVTRAHL